MFLIHLKGLVLKETLVQELYYTVLFVFDSQNNKKISHFVYQSFIWESDNTGQALYEPIHNNHLFGNHTARNPENHLILVFIFLYSQPSFQKDPKA